MCGRPCATLAGRRRRSPAGARQHHQCARGGRNAPGGSQIGMTDVVRQVGRRLAASSSHFETRVFHLCNPRRSPDAHAHSHILLA
eukprot:324895-Chlamydomonas_euryale.AAC.1